MAQQSTYELIGGAETIRKLVEAFYPKVQRNQEIGHLFPEDITPVMEKQYMFLTQFFGGPALYTDAFGHPMMRARHLPFEITETRAKAWLSCMNEALAEIELSEPLRALVLEKLAGPAYHFINTAE
ncbi:hypothetical protein J40TS1_28090 [Paenibacillus montaniterrae]|uniref:Globin n=1 Tax=Paenibacillus montaniterrae TaxID=429341 RepID=A0A920CUL8_9BACL|nr:globin [Paenibacillus montaniterrae]GIP17167.1 hypothetical protein J40TS1_28090 [Paenibacillus montaniterrae]